MINGKKKEGMQDSSMKHCCVFTAVKTRQVVKGVRMRVPKWCKLSELAEDFPWNIPSNKKILLNSECSALSCKVSDEVVCQKFLLFFVKKMCIKMNVTAVFTFKIILKKRFSANTTVAFYMSL